MQPAISEQHLETHSTIIFFYRWASWNASWFWRRCSDGWWTLGRPNCPAKVLVSAALLQCCHAGSRPGWIKVLNKAFPSLFQYSFGDLHNMKHVNFGSTKHMTDVANMEAVVSRIYWFKSSFCLTCTLYMPSQYSIWLNMFVLKRSMTSCYQKKTAASHGLATGKGAEMGMHCLKETKSKSICISQEQPRNYLDWSLDGSAEPWWGSKACFPSWSPMSRRSTSRSFMEQPLGLMQCAGCTRVHMPALENSS